MISIITWYIIGILVSALTEKPASLQRTKQLRSQDAGEPFDSPVFVNEITLLNSL